MSDLLPGLALFQNTSYVYGKFK